MSQTSLVPPIVADLLEQGEPNFNKQTNRKLLVQKLKEQYSAITIHEKVQTNIELLSDDNTFTVTTGHQLCLLGGPAYFIYKIISTIKACELYAKQYPEKNFVPVFWLASEDHDFEEVNHFYLFGKKVEWKTTQAGAVGRMKTEGFNEVFNELKSILPEIPNFFSLSSTSPTSSLSSFTRLWLNKLFGDQGLIIIDADDADLKRSFSNVITKEFEEQVGKKVVEKTNEELAKKYKVQVNPRDINFFKLEEGKRERFTAENSFNWKELLLSHPGVFSPNVIYRPLYQEFILPNVAYVGGPNELAYWFQLKDLFSVHELAYPQLILRDSFLILNNNQRKVLNALQINVEDILLNSEQLKSNYVASKMEINDEIFQQGLMKVFDSLKAEVSKIDSTLEATIDAERAKNLKSLENLFGRIKKADKSRHEIDLNKIDKLKNQLFPEGVFQERRVNFMEFYSRLGEDYLNALYLNANPLNSCLKVLVEE